MEENIETKIEGKKFNFARFHDGNYKKLLLIPIIILLLAIISLIIFYNQTGDFFNKDISLTGGTSVTIFGEFDSALVESELAENLDEVSTRIIYDLTNNEKKAIIIETKSDAQTTREVLETYVGYKFDSENSSFEFTGSALSESFYKQLLIALLIAFLFMSIVVFILFRTFIPSTAVIISAFADIVMTLALINVLDMELSSAGIVALLMLIGYSVDTDILLTTRILKRHEGSLNERIYGAFKTGITMTLTSLFAVLLALIVVRSFSVVLTQIFTILIIGLSFDILNTWVTNVSILKWYVERKRK